MYLKPLFALITAALLTPTVMAQTKIQCLLSASSNFKSNLTKESDAGQILALNDCRPLAVQQGSASIFLRKANGQSTRYQLSEGEKLADKLTDQSFGTGMLAMAKTIKTVLSGVTDTKAGLSYANETRDLPGFPQGEILMPSVPLLFNFAGTPVTFSSFELTTSNGKRIHSQSGGNTSFSVPHKLLAANTTYRWRLSLQDKVIEDEFSIVSKQEQTEVMRTLSNATKGVPENSKDVLLIEALELEKLNFTYDRDRKIHRLGQMNEQ